jgi:hypothetical protein
MMKSNRLLFDCDIHLTDASAESFGSGAMKVLRTRRWEEEIPAAEIEDGEQ